EALRQQPLVLFQLLALRAAGAPDHLRAVGTEKCSAVVADLGSQATGLAFLIHDVQLQVAVTYRGEDELPAARAPGCLRVITGSHGEPFDAAAIGPGFDDVVAVIQGPHVSLRVVGWLGASLASLLGRGVNDPVRLGIIEIAAG